MFAHSRLMLWLASLLLIVGGVLLGFAYTEEAEATASLELLADVQAALDEAQVMPDSDAAQLLNFTLPAFDAPDVQTLEAPPLTPATEALPSNHVVATTPAQSTSAMNAWPNTSAETMLASPAVWPPTQGKWIDVNISKQRVTAYIGSQAVKTVIVSTGTRSHPTVVGTYRVYAKIPKQRMTGGSRARGDYYSLPNVPNVMYFYRGYAIHGTYWHKNFGRPMSHGCVNLTLTDAKWFYDWTPMGTLVYSHY